LVKGINDGLQAKSKGIGRVVWLIIFVLLLLANKLNLQQLFQCLPVKIDIAHIVEDTDNDLVFDADVGFVDEYLFFVDFVEENGAIGVEPFL